MRNSKPQNPIATYLNQHTWDYYCTLSTSYTLTSKSARRAMIRFSEHLKERFGGANIFWVSEPFDLKEGCHLHALIKINKSIRYSDYLAKKALLESWQIVTANTSNVSKLHCLHIRKYNRKLGGNFYVTKYIDKPNADYDFFFNIPSDEPAKNELLKSYS